MKKILILILVLSLSLSVMVGCDKLAEIIPGLGTGDTHEHNFVEGKCECGETDPNYVAPHEHNFVAGKCECGEEDPNYVPPVEEDADLKAAYDYIHQSAKEILKETGANYELPTSATIGNKNYTAEWTVTTDLITFTPHEDKENVVVVNIPRVYEDVSYTLKFTITNEKGDTLSREYSHIIPAFKVASFEEYMAAKKDDVLTVKGIVVAISSKSAGAKRNHVYVADESGVGGYYNYNMVDDPATLGIKAGMTVLINGKISPSNGMQEFYQGTVEIIDETIKEVPTSDITELFAQGASLDNYVARIVTIKGVTLGNQDLSTANSQYLYFALGENKSYIRTYITDFPSTLQIVTDANGIVSSPDKDAIDALHASKFGWTADVTGILIYYSGSPYLVPVSVDCFTNLKEVERTDAEKVAAELDGLTFDSTFTSDAVIELVLNGKNYENVTITWTSDNEAIVIADGKATVVVPNDTVVVKLTATVTCGEASDSKVFEVKLSKSLTPVADAIATGAAKDHNTYTEEKYLIGGIITEVYNTTYGNMYITDAEGNVLTVYGTYDATGTNRYDAMENKPVAGDYVVILGVLGQYNDNAQVKNGWIMSYTTPTSVKDAIDLGAAKEHNDFTGDKILVTGTITEVYNTTYGNMYITDAEGNVLTIYGTYDATGLNRYDAMTKQPVAGDVVTIYGVPGRYNETKQIKNGWIVAVTAGSTDTPHEHVFVEGKCECGEEDPNYVPPTVDPDPVDGVELTVDSLGVASQSYAAGTATVGGVSFEFVQIGNYGDGIQVRDKNGNTSTLWNTTAFGSAIKEIVLVYSDSKDVTHANADCEIFTFGNAMGEATCTVKLSTEAGVKTYTITPDAQTYTFFKFEHDLGYTMYWKSITIVLVDGSTVTPNPDPHEHVFVEGKCECGVEDPNYVPPTGPVEVTIPEALAAEVGTEIIVTGTVESFYYNWDDSYGNCSVYIVDEAGNKLLAFRLATKVEVGDNITVTGTIAAYNGVNQIGAGCTAVINPTDTPEGIVEMTITEALSATVGTQVKLTGTVCDIYNVWNDQYGNMSVYITDESGARIIVYRTTVVLQLGDVITVTGEIGAYNGVNQIAQGNTVTIDAPHVCSEFTDATCTDLAACVLCGKTTGSLLNHNYVDGKCECGAEEGVEAITASKTMAELITELGWTSSTTKQEFALDDVISVKVDGGNNTGKAYNGNHIRIYATDTPAGTLTISAAEGYELVSIKITTETGTYAFLYVGEGTEDICNTTVAVSGSSVVLNSVKNGSDGKQVRVLAIEVTYKAA